MRRIVIDIPAPRDRDGTVWKGTLVISHAKRLVALLLAGWSILALAAPAATEESKLQRLKYNHPGLAVDLGAGLWAWPLPMDVNGDGRIDRIVNEEDVPYNGVYVFEHPGTNDKLPVFKPARRPSNGMINAEAAKGLKVLIEPFDAGIARVGFYEAEDGAVVEFMEYYNKPKE